MESGFSNEVTNEEERDYEAPKLISVSPVKNSTLSANPEFIIAASDNVAVENISVAYSPKASNERTTVYSQDFNDKEVMVSAVWNTENIPSGYYDLTFTIKDTSGRSKTLIYNYRLINDVPASVIITAESGGFSVKLSWEEINTNTDYYRVYRSSDNGASYEYLGRTYEKEYEDKNLDHRKTYYYKIYVVDVYGNKKESQIVQAQPEYLDIEPPVANAGFDTTGVSLKQISRMQPRNKGHSK